MDLGLTNKIALLSAASDGLGFAVAVELVKEGANVAICGRSQEKLDKARKQLQQLAVRESQVLAVSADLTQRNDVVHFVDATVKTWGGIDLVLTNAGGPPKGQFATASIADFETAFQLTLMSVVHVLQTSLPYLRQSKTPSVLTVTSYSTKQPIPGLLMSNIFRPAVVGLTKTLSQELGPENIRVNSILPGWTETEHAKHLVSSEKAKAITQQIPLRRMAKPEEFGKVAAFLLSPAASYINGAMLPVDGGIIQGLL